MDHPSLGSSASLMADWFRRVRESQHIHYECSGFFSRLNYFLGIPTITLSSLVGTAVFVSLDKQNIGNFKIAVGLVSILAAILASLQTFLGLAERSEKHRLTAAGYAAIRRALEMLEAFPPDQKEDLEQALSEIKNQMDALAKSSPEVPQKIRNRVYRELKGRDHERIFQLPGRQ